jgi:hypothetical protein
MFSKLIGWVKQNLFVFLLIAAAIIGSTAYISYDTLKNPPDLKDFKGSVQNHLVWSITGDCYFVRPYSSSTVYLIPVQDCNKGNK